MTLAEALATLRDFHDHVASHDQGVIPMQPIIEAIGVVLAEFAPREDKQVRLQWITTGHVLQATVEYAAILVPERDAVRMHIRTRSRDDLLRLATAFLTSYTRRGLQDVIQDAARAVDRWTSRETDQ